MYQSAKTDLKPGISNQSAHDDSILGNTYESSLSKYDSVNISQNYGLRALRHKKNGDPLIRASHNFSIDQIIDVSNDESQEVTKTQTAGFLSNKFMREAFVSPKKILSRSIEVSARFL